VFASKKAAGLLAFLACTAPESQRRERLIDLLWGSHFETQARQNLRQTLYVLRRALGDASILTAGCRFTEAIRYTSEALRLRPGFQGAQRLRCASMAMAGRINEAQALLAALRREQPQLSIDWIRESVPYQTPRLIKHFVEGMRKAGLT